MSSRRPTLAVAAGATAGATTRWAIVEALPDPTGWPWAIFMVNVVGSLLLGAVLAATHHRTDDRTFDPIRLAVGTGFCGALTTFSTFAAEIAAFVRDDRLSFGATYLTASLAVGIAAFVGGRALVRTWVAS